MLPSRRRQSATARNTSVRPPDPHPSGAKPPAIPLEFVPKHVAIVMDGNGRWANARGLPRVEGHKRGEEVVLDVIRGAIEIGVKWVSLYAFSTENWKRSPDEVRFLMNFNRDVIHRRVETFDALGVRVRWAGRLPKLWRSVVNELKIAEERTKHHDVLNLTMCVNYGGRAELTDATRQIAKLAAAGELNPDRIDERTLAKYMYQPEMPDVDLFIRPSGEQRISNFMLWQSAYAELVFQDILWPDFNRMHLWRACENYARRDRRFGAAIDATGDADAAVDGQTAAEAAGETITPTRTVLNGADLVQDMEQPEEAR